MDLGLRGKTLQSVKVEHSVRLQLSDLCFVVIESSFTLDDYANTMSLSPEEEGDKTLQALSPLISRAVADATVDEVGTLRVVLDGGARLTVEPDPTYEAWSVSGPRGALVVSTPGGKLAVWTAQPKDSESAASDKSPR